MERRSKRRKLNLGEVVEQRSKKQKVNSENAMDRKGCSYDFENVPDEILLKIFRSLSITERWIFGRVCKKFYNISRDPDPVFWKKVHIYPETDNAWGYNITVERILELFQILPKNVTSLKISLDSIYKEDLNFAEFSEYLLKACPNLQELSIEHAIFIDPNSSTTTYNLSNLLPRTITVLKLREIDTSNETYLKFDDSYTSSIEILDVKYSYLNLDSNFLLQMPRLRELRPWRILGKDILDSIQSVIRKLNILDLKESFEGVDIFQRVLNYGINLSVLYLCYTDLQDEDIRLLEPTTVVPRLKKLCLRGCPVTFKRINSLIKCRLTLEQVYVGGLEENHDYRRFDYTRCNSIKVIFDNECDLCVHDVKDFDENGSIL